MYVFIKSKLIKLIHFLIFIAFSAVFSQGFLQTSGKNIINGNGDKVILKGIALGGWWVPEGYMFQIPGSGSPTTIRNKIVNLIGVDAANEFYKKFENNYVQELDIKAISGWGFNSIRLPMHYKFLSPSKDEYIEKKMK